MLDFKYHIIICIPERPPPPSTHTHTFFHGMQFRFLLSYKYWSLCLQLQDQMIYFGKGGGRGYHWSHLGREDSYPRNGPAIKKENFWPLKLMTQLHWETAGWRNHFCKKSYFLFFFLRVITKICIRVEAFFGVKAYQACPSSLQIVLGRKQGTEVPKYPLLVQTICIYRFARLCLHRISLYKYY